MDGETYMEMREPLMTADDRREKFEVFLSAEEANEVGAAAAKLGVDASYLLREGGLYEARVRTAGSPVGETLRGLRAARGELG